MGKVEYRIIGSTAIGSLLFKGILVEFVVDVADLERIRPLKWHYASNAYIATTMVVQDLSGLQKKKEVYLHNFLGQPPPGWTVQHSTRNGLDNRRANLRLIEGTPLQDRPKQRTVELPLLSGVKAEEIPKHIWYVQANGYHRDRFAIEFKTEGILWKSSSSKDLSLVEKLDQAKAKLQELYGEYPHLDPKREEEVVAELKESFRAIFLPPPNSCTSSESPTQ